MDVSRPAQTSGDVLEAAGSAASWLFNNAGKIKDLIDLVDALTG
jgi:hypothetical protein